MIYQIPFGCDAWLGDGWVGVVAKLKLCSLLVRPTPRYPSHSFRLMSDPTLTDFLNATFQTTNDIGRSRVNGLVNDKERHQEQLDRTVNRQRAAMEVFETNLERVF